MKSIQAAERVIHKKQFSFSEAKQIGESLGIRWTAFGVEQFRMGLGTELEHGRQDPATDVTNDLPVLTGKIALTHLNAIPDYYTRLAAMEKEAERSTNVRGRERMRGKPPLEKNTVPVMLYALLFGVMFVMGLRRVGEGLQPIEFELKDHVPNR